MALGIQNTMVARLCQYVRYLSNEVNFGSTRITFDRLLTPWNRRLWHRLDQKATSRAEKVVISHILTALFRTLTSGTLVKTTASKGVSAEQWQWWRRRGRLDLCQMTPACEAMAASADTLDEWCSLFTAGPPMVDPSICLAEKTENRVFTSTNIDEKTDG